MFKEASKDLDKIFDILEEIESYNFYRSQIINKLDTLFQLYQQGRIDSLKYEELRQKILKGKSRKELIQGYNDYIMMLLKQVHNYNTLMFEALYKTDIGAELSSIIPEKEVKKPEVRKPVEHKLPKEHIPQKPVEIKPRTLDVKPAEEAPEPHAEKQKEIRPAKKPETAKHHASFLERINKLVGKVKTWYKGYSEKQKKAKELAKIHKEEKSKKREEEKKKAAPAKTKKADFPEEKEAAQKKPKIKLEKKNFFARFLDKIRMGLKQEKKESILPKELQSDTVNIRKGGGIEKSSVKSLVTDWLDKNVFRKKYLSEKTIVSPSLIRLADVSLQDFSKRKAESSIDPDQLLREAKEIKKKMKQQKSTPVYKPLLIGSIANVTVRPFTNYLITKFPGFFKKFYNQLRLANIQILSNTYANIMVFVTVNMFMITSLVYFIISIMRLQPLIVAITGALIVGLISGLVSFFGFYYYPNTIITKRRKSIKTNLPFAINHIAAIASSGVPPTPMFKLIAESMEYGEFCVELQKVVDYIELFGYDLVTAVRSVAETTPEEGLREFFEGMLNTIESGGGLEKFLFEKSKEAMATYELERRKYTETISTYSDIYTGVLIAAPLFFVAALTLVSMLGGTIGRFNISTVIAFATYILIPVLNIGFIIFLNMSQPEV